MGWLGRIRDALHGGGEPAAEAPPFPESVILEVTNRCNLRCRLCHFHAEDARGSRPLGRMDEALWRPALDEIGGWDAEVVVSASGAGEPLLHPQAWDLAAHATSKPNIRFGFLCNGMLYGEAEVARTFELDLDWIKFSVDGCDKEVFEHYRRNAELETVARGIRLLAEERRRRGGTRPHIGLNMVLYPELAGHVPVFLEHWRGLVDEVSVAACRPVGERTFLKDPPPRYPCALPRSQMVVAWDGRVGLCCEDIFCDVEVGRFPDEALLAVWRGERMSRARAAEAAGRWDEVPICRDCDVWSTDRTTRRVEGPWEVLEGTAMTTYRALPPAEGRAG